MEFENLKKIPHSLEAERALIGGIFYNQDLFDEIRLSILPSIRQWNKFTLIVKV